MSLDKALGLKPKKVTLPVKKKTTPTTSGKEINVMTDPVPPMKIGVVTPVVVRKSKMAVIQEEHPELSEDEQKVYHLIKDNTDSFPQTEYKIRNWLQWEIQKTRDTIQRLLDAKLIEVVEYMDKVGYEPIRGTKQ